MRTGLAAAAAALTLLVLIPGAASAKRMLKVGGRVVDVCGGAPCHAVP